MDRLIYSSMTGAKAMLDRQDALAHNLANASTDGFRAQTTAFRSAPIRQDGTATTRVFALDVTTGFDATPGPIHNTGDPLDIAVNGTGWIAVQGADGTEGYTRDGGLVVDADGVLRNKRGQLVVGDGGPINVPANSTIVVGMDGSVAAKTGNQPPVNVGRIKLVDPPLADLVRSTDGLMRLRNGDDAPASETVRVADGAVEGSNVNVVEAMVSMIAVSRQFEMQMKMLETAQNDDQRATQLLSVR